MKLFILGVIVGFSIPAVFISCVLCYWRGYEKGRRMARPGATRKKV